MAITFLVLGFKRNKWQFCDQHINTRRMSYNMPYISKV